MTESFSNTYLKTIRSIILVDENFPTITPLAPRINEGIRTEEKATKEEEEEAKAKAAEEEAKAKAAAGDRRIGFELYQSITQDGYICDILNNPNADNIKRIQNADLAILDYHLSSHDGSDASLCIQIILRLIAGGSSNFIIVYTNEPNPQNVVLNILVNALGCVAIHDNVATRFTRDLSDALGAADIDPDTHASSLDEAFGRFSHAEMEDFHKQFGYLTDFIEQHCASSTDPLRAARILARLHRLYLDKAIGLDDLEVRLAAVHSQKTL